MRMKTLPTIARLPLLSALGVVLSLGAVASNSSAVVLANYEFAGGSALSTDTEPVTTAEDYLATIAPNTSTYSGISSSSANAFFFSFQTAGDLVGSIAENDYHTFTLETNGATVNLDALNFSQEFWNTATTLTFSVSVLSSFDGFATPGLNLGNFSIAGSGYTNGDTAAVARSIDLSSIAQFQGLTSNVDFRFYFYDNSSATDRTHRLDNIVLNGTVTPVPEPSSQALVIVAIGAVTLVRYRRKAALRAASH